MNRALMLVNYRRRHCSNTRRTLSAAACLVDSVPTAGYFGQLMSGLMAFMHQNQLPASCPPIWQ
jgi:hypothetical protein